MLSTPGAVSSSSKPSTRKKPNTKLTLQEGAEEGQAEEGGPKGALEIAMRSVREVKRACLPSLCMLGSCTYCLLTVRFPSSSSSPPPLNSPPHHCFTPYHLASSSPSQLFTTDRGGRTTTSVSKRGEVMNKGERTEAKMAEKKAMLRVSDFNRKHQLP